MSNNTGKDSKKAADNKVVTGVEVVKDDTVVFEDGNFEEYNAEHHYQEDKAQDKKADSATKEGQSAKKDDKSNEANDTNKEEKSSKNNKSAAKETKAEQKDDAEQNDADKEGQSDEDSNPNMSMAGLFQWASKLREDFMSEAMGLTNGVTEKATAMTLERLIAVVDMELAAFDKSVDVAKKLIANVEEERSKIASRKEKYQDMIDKLDQE